MIPTKKEIDYARENKCSTPNCYNYNNQTTIYCNICLHGHPTQIHPEIIKILRAEKPKGG